MNGEDRRDRRRRAMRRRILDAALELFVKRGFENVTLRGIARRIDYSPAAIYRYFKDKNAILAALRQEGFGLFIERQRELEAIADPVARLKAGGRTYLAFARERPGYFHLMFNLEVAAGECDQRDWGETPGLSFSLLNKSVMDCAAAGHFAGPDPQAAVFGLWAGVHGLANLLISGRLEALAGERRLEELLENIATFLVRPESGDSDGRTGEGEAS